jgi:hypothetical protein
MVSLMKFLPPGEAGKGLHVKSEMHNVAILNHVFLSFDGNFAGIAAGAVLSQAYNIISRI